MAKCPTCKGELVCRNCATVPAAKSQEEGDGAVLPCPKDKANATIYVRSTATKTGIPKISVSLSDAMGPSKTDGSGFAVYKNIPPGSHTATLTLDGVEKKFALPTGSTGRLEKVAPAGGDTFYVLDLDPIGPLTVRLKRKDKPAILVPGIKVTVQSATPESKNTGDNGEAVFESLRKNSYEVTIALEGNAAEQYSITDGAAQTFAFDPGAEKNEVEFKLARMIYLRLKYKDPEGNPHVFPKDFDVSVVYNDRVKKAVKILDDAGNLEFPIEEGKTDFTLEFESAAVRYLVHTQDSPEAEWKLQAPLAENADESTMNQWTIDGKRFFALPKKWSLAMTKWEAAAVTVPPNGKIAIPDNGIGTKAAPGILTLLPTCQYVRFEFYDRKYGHSDHGDKRISIPAVPLKGARKSTEAGIPETPSAGTHDTISNWMIDATDAAKACQSLPWIITKTDAGVDLPKLDKTMLLEFGWTDGFVHSTSATERKVIAIPSGDAKRKPTKDRNLYYDLPKVWKSVNYFTRFADPAKSRFFDELSDSELEPSLVKTTPLVFCLDDIVLETNAASQEVEDKKRDGVAIAIDKHSRISILHCDEADKLKVKVFDPRPKAGFHSKSEFRKLASADTRRNYIVDYALNSRAVVFCSEFYDIYDKRTATADFTKKQVLGARAARCKDDEISGRALIDGYTDAAYKNGYTCRAAGYFDLHYLHYASTDGTTVYGVLVTFWASRFFFQDDAAYIPAGSGFTPDGLFKVDNATRGNGELSDKLNYITEGMVNAMRRWNEKAYQLEELDGKTNLAIKAFCLFEAKEFEEPSASGTFIDRGGIAQCNSALVKNQLGSWMARRVARLRRSGYTDEGAWWGTSADTEARLTEFDGTTSPARVALAHEIGHASGLDDDYVYYVNGYTGLVRYEQYFPGMPYKLDKSSLMNVNQAIRLRHYWGRVNWLNDESGSSLNTFLGGVKFKICYEPSGKPKLNFELTKAEYKQIYLPAYEKANYTLDLSGRCGFFLYKLGDDEFNRWLKGGPYSGIVVVVLKLSAKFIPGLIPAPPDWVTGTVYAKSACVHEGGKSWVCVTSHTASASFGTDAANWAELSPTAGWYSWTAGTTYHPQEWTYEGTDTYSCVTSHVAGSFEADLTADKWIKMGTYKNNWAVSTAYSKTDLVEHVGSYYVCVTPHTSSDFDQAFVAGQWVKATTDTGDYQGGTAYVKENCAIYKSHPYCCAVDHTSGSFDDDVAAGRWVKTDSKHTKWSDSKKKDWAGALNRDLEAMLEGANGKYKFTCGTGDFQKIYLRLFVQWEFPKDSDAATAGTHFEITVTHDNRSWLKTAAQVVEAGSSANNNTLIRYMFGKASADSGGRANDPTITKALTKPDLAKLGEWIKSVAGGDYTAEDIV